MEFKGSHYKLHEILAQMQSVEDMNLTRSAALGIKELGMSQTEALEVIRALTRENAVKTMTTHADHKVWQDVYRSEWQGIQLYIKFQLAKKYFVISFKERTDE